MIRVDDCAIFIDVGFRLLKLELEFLPSFNPFFSLSINYQNFQASTTYNIPCRHGYMSVSFVCADIQYQFREQVNEASPMLTANQFPHDSIFLFPVP